MIGDFIKKVVNNRYTKQEDVYASIVNKVMQKSELPEGIDDLDEDVYDSEVLLGKNIYPTCIYIFKYNASNPTTYTYNKQTVKFYDSMPIVLVTSLKGNILRGINLNYCNPALKALLLDLVVSLDEKFFNGGCADLVASQKMPLSKNLLQCFQKNDFEQQIINKLESYYKDILYQFIFRNYDIKKIGIIRLIEPWQWVDLPKLARTGTTPESTLKAIWKITGIDKVKI